MERHDIDHRTEDRPLIDWIFSEDGHRHHEFDPYSMAGDRVGFEGSLTRSPIRRGSCYYQDIHTRLEAWSEQVHADSSKQEAGVV